MVPAGLEWRAGRRALLAFVALSLTSLFADLTYEGARSIVGPYLSVLGASLVVAGAVSLGDLVSYSARFLGGALAQRLASPRWYWGLVFLGYTVNLVAVPLLALAGSWWLALALILIERTGKGLRTAPRDAILAEVSAGIPRGLAFSLHELADQAGAVGGALLVAWILASRHTYHAAFQALAVPAALALASLGAAYTLHPTLREAAEAKRLRHSPGAREPLPGTVVAAIAAGGLGMAALMHWAQASYRLASTGLSGVGVAGLYALAMLSDALAALPMGALYDRRPRAALALGPLLSAAATAALLTPRLNPAAAAALWGAAMAVYETAYRAAASTAPEGRRGEAYALLYASMGAGWAAGNLVLALLPPSAGAAFAALAGAAGAAAALARWESVELSGYYKACGALWGRR